MPRVLLSSVFKPFGIDNLYSRKDSFPEVYHNRLTRPQGIFSYRTHFNVFGLHVIANNISAPSVVLDYPTLDGFIAEVKKGYDYVGIGSVVPNFQKVKLMAEAVRKYAPKSKIVIGGYCAHIDDIRELVPLDYLCIGDGITFMRELLGDAPEYRYQNPYISTHGYSFLGVPLFGQKSPQIITGMGCPYGCEFCAPSYHFSRKYKRLYQHGEELFREMERLEKRFRSRAFGFHGDENFLLSLDRADELRECVVKSGKQYEIFHFGSADKAREFGPERMAEMGTNILWIGRESGLVSFPKTQGIDLKALVEDCHRHGIKIVISTMLLMDHHTPENIWEDIEEHISLKPDFSMFTFYIPLPGTPLYERFKEEDRILQGFAYEDWNGVGTPYTRHPHFTPAQGRELRERILELEYHRLGPSAMRLIRTDLEGYLFMKDSENPNLRRRAQYLAKKMPRYRALLWAMERLAPTPEMRDMIQEVRAQVERAFGPLTSFEKTQALGLYAFGTKEKLKYKWLGDVIQPPTIVTVYPGRS